MKVFDWAEQEQEIQEPVHKKRGGLRTVAVLASLALLATWSLKFGTAQQSETESSTTTTAPADDPERTASEIPLRDSSRIIRVNTNDENDRRNGAVADCIQSFPRIGPEQLPFDFFDPHGAMSVLPQFDNTRDETVWLGEGVARFGQYRFGLSDGWSVHYDEEEDRYVVREFSSSPNTGSDVDGKLVGIYTPQDLDEPVVFDNIPLRLTMFNQGPPIANGEFISLSVNCVYPTVEVEVPVPMEPSPL